MANRPAAEIAEEYNRNGFVSPVDVISTEEAQAHRVSLEGAEARIGGLHYLAKVHTILTSPFRLAVNPRALDIAQAILGPDILLYNVTYIIKEPHTPSHVSWHQDLTYWGLSHDDQVSMWLALSPATESSGCMRMVPGSHLNGMLKHDVTEDETNVLFQGQTVQGVGEESSIMCPLQPGQASFHHGWTLHASMPNNSDDRRIGLNVQYLAAHVRQTKHDLDTAILVRGEDRFGNFDGDVPACTDLAPEALERHRMLNERYIEITGQA